MKVRERQGGTAEEGVGARLPSGAVDDAGWSVARSLQMPGMPHVSGVVSMYR